MKFVITVNPDGGDTQYRFSTDLQVLVENTITGEALDGSEIEEVILPFASFANAIDSLRILQHAITREQDDADSL